MNKEDHCVESNLEELKKVCKAAMLSLDEGSPQQRKGTMWSLILMKSQRNYSKLPDEAVMKEFLRIMQSDLDEQEECYQGSNLDEDKRYYAKL